MTTIEHALQPKAELPDGFPLAGMFIHPQPENGKLATLDYSPEELLFFWQLVEEVDARLTQQAKSGETELVALKKPASEVLTTRNAFDQSLAATLTSKPQVGLVHILYGTTQAHVETYNQIGPDARSRLFSAIISGTAGSHLDDTHVLTPVAGEMLTIPFLGVRDDVVDSGKALGAITELRWRERFGRSPEEVDLTVQLLGAAKGPFEAARPLYKRLARYMRESGVFMAIPWVKNQPLRLSLIEETGVFATTRWGRLQKYFLDHQVGFSQYEWLMGGLELDTGLDGASLWDLLPDDVKVEHHALLRNLPRSVVRVGCRIPDLVAMPARPPAENIGALTEFVAPVLAQKLVPP